MGATLLEHSDAVDGLSEEVKVSHTPATSRATRAILPDFLPFILGAA